MNIVFAGTPVFAAQHLKCLIDSEHSIVGVITQPDKPGKRGKKTIPSAVKKLALQEQLPVIQPHKLTVDDLDQFEADVMVVVAYGQILRGPVLELLRFGCINVHGSMLPRWRGAAPIQRAVLSGDSESGVCVIQMDKGLDTGAILASKTCKVSAVDTSATLAAKLASLSTELLPKVLSQIEMGQLQAIPQKEEGVLYAHKIDKSEAEIDWSRPSIDIMRKILGFNPDPIAFTWINEFRMKIWAATNDEKPHHYTPGEIISISKQGMGIACGVGCLNITQLQLPLGKGSVLNMSDVLNARKDMFSPGVILGNAGLEN